jgi:hypothetical protein
MPPTDKVRRDFMITVCQDRGTPPSVRVEFVPRGLQADRGPDGLPKRVPRFLARARLQGDTIVADWEVPPPEDYKVGPEELKQEAKARLAKRLEWLARLSKLIDTVEGWARPLGWSTKRVPKELNDSEIGAYQTSALLLQEGTTRVLLEPVGSSAPGADGVVDLYLLPAYDDIATLYYYEDRWNLHLMAAGAPVVGNIHEADSKPLSKTSLRKVLEQMKQSAA